MDITGEVQFGNVENSICTNYINAGATIANNSYFCVGRAAGTDTYLEVSGGAVQTTGTLTIGTCGSEASKGEMVVKTGEKMEKLAFAAAAVLSAGALFGAEAFT